jgi:acyl-coenzyme A synthetase/AMP-(fatty) acid ligase
MTSALAAALLADTDHVACFTRDGVEHGWQDLLAAAARVRDGVAQLDGRRWALNLDDTFQFASALLGCWAARRIPVLAPRPLLEGQERSLAIDGVIESGAANASARPRNSSAVRATPASTGGRPRIDWQSLAPASAPLGAVSADAELVLYTSGSTGVPKEVTRRLRNVEAEVAAFESLWGTGVGAARVYSTVSHRHVYGMLFRLLWPLLSRRPFAAFDLEFPEQLIGAATAGQIVVSSPALLKRIGHLPAGAGSWRAVFSSGGLLPPEAAADAARVLGACPIEVLGSTETSGVAWRRQAPPDPETFTTLPSVEIRLGADELLEARSPFSGDPGWLTMGDRARLADAGRFALLGRGDHLAKIEDKRVSLAEIERLLLETEWVKEAAAVALEERGRQYVGVVLQLSGAGAAELARRGRRSFGETLKASLRARIESVALPRKYRYVDELPVDKQGKRQQSALRQLFRRS